MPKHALLSASSAHRWLACPPSARTCEAIEERASPYAEEGTAAHKMCEYKIKKALGQDVDSPAEGMGNAEMDGLSDEYCSFVMEQLESAKELCPDPIVMVEKHLDFSRWIPDGYGIGDCVIVADQVLHIVDYKYGLGVLVDAKGNPQMRCYALGVLDTYDGIYDIEIVKMTIFQPRKGNISTDEISKTELLEWAENTLAPTAKLAYEGKGEYKAGEHCRFCRIRSTCRKRAESNLEMAKYDFALPPTLDDAEIAVILARVDDLTAWAGDIKEYALQKALSGTVFQGFKLVEGRSTRKYTDEAAVADMVTKAGYNPYEEKLRGITAMSQMLGGKKFDELLGGLVYKPPGKPALVPESDKRPAMNTAIDDFKMD